MASSFVRVCALVRNYPGIPWYLFQIPSNGLFGNVRLKRPRFGKKTTFCSMIFSMYCNFVDFWYFCFGCYCKFIFGHTTAGFWCAFADVSCSGNGATMCHWIIQWAFQEPKKLEIPIPYNYRPIFQGYLREYPQKIWPYMVQYLHFRILKFPLNYGTNTRWQDLRHGTSGCSEGKQSAPQPQCPAVVEENAPWRATPPRTWEGRWFSIAVVNYR